MNQAMHAAVAEVMGNEGFKPIEDFVVHGGEMHVSRRVAAHFKSLGLPGTDRLDGAESLAEIALARPFMHPLAAPLAGDAARGVNSWGCVSMVINAAMMWGDQPNDDGLGAWKMLQQWVRLAEPGLDLADMLKRIRWDDDALMRLAAIAQSGFEQMAESFSAEP
ncbi:hypothetical protein IQ266_27115 [filamentous cyanobacterium LEGE 11480]|uniref:Uncharacterized protein n=1 Tax=Romeriopsis navalis LEGE 11480 TaxID=2777977 RepID=A0A928VRZ5_9CYAN|nr:hypothetical protein [Romeriopsis navalis]MBE9033405.1 hypothetical protein [Romeriopsis navalis LEGE 11480]